MTDRRLCACLLLLWLPVVAGCVGHDDRLSPSLKPAGVAAGPDAAAAPADSAAALLAAIRREIGTAHCTAAAQCRTLPVGWKACGGPEAYLPWSTAAAAAAAADRLAALAADQQRARRRDVERSGMLSNCMLATDPGAVCAPAAGGKLTCQLRPAAAALTAQ